MTVPPLRFGLPPVATLQSYRIWDCYFTPAHSHPGRDGSEALLEAIESSLPAADLGCFERLCYFAHVGIGTTGDPALESRLAAHPAAIRRPLEKWPERLMAMVHMNANDVEASLAALQRWVAEGPMVGAYFPGGGPAALACTHRNFDPLVRRLGELGGVIIQHTWFKTGGKRHPGESTPAELARLATRFPEQQFVCAHAGGQWQNGIRAVREHKNILVETSGFDATAGFIEMAVRELGPHRVVFGSHLPSRSLGTELAKVIAAEIPEHHKRLILGENFRRLLAGRG